MAEALLFEHEDGRYAVAMGPESPEFTRGDPKWHRLGPVDVSALSTNAGEAAEPVAWCMSVKAPKPWFGKGWTFSPVQTENANMPLYAHPPAAVHGQSASTEHRDALMKLSQFAHTAAHMSARDASNNLLSIADQLITLANPPAAIPAAQEASKEGREHLSVKAMQAAIQLGETRWRGWDGSLTKPPEVTFTYCIGRAVEEAVRAALAQPAPVQPLIDWVVERWHAEVKNRPMVNIHRRSLDDAWRQMLRHLGVDDRARLGPTHDELRAEIGSKEWEAMNGKAAPVQQEAAGDAVKALMAFADEYAAAERSLECATDSSTSDQERATLESAIRAALQPTQGARSTSPDGGSHG